MAEYIKREDALAFPIRINHCDRKHRNDDFLLGIEEEAVFDCNDQFVLSDFCPHCGADMREVEHETDDEEYNGLDQNR